MWPEGVLISVWMSGWLNVFCCSYMETEQYEEAVRDYEHVYQTEKTKGQNQDALLLPRWLGFLVPCSACFYSLLLLCYCRTQTPPEERPAGVEEKQEERLLQSSRSGQERHRRGDQESVSQTGAFTPSRCLHMKCPQRVLIAITVQTDIGSLVSVQTATVVLALRFRRKKRRSSRRSGKLSACCQTQRRGLDMTAVRTLRTRAWTWEVSNGGTRQVGGLEDR